MRPHYVESPLPAPLDRHVECCWSFSEELPPGVEHVHGVLPDGCADIVFDLGGALPQARLVGTMTRPLTARLRGRVDVFGIRFRPGGARPYWHLPMHECTDRLAEAAGLDALEPARLALRLVEAGDFPSRVRLTAAWLAAAAAPPPERRIQRALALMAGRRPPALARLAPQVGFSARQLERAFAAEVGVSPRTWRRYLRFRSALELARGRPAARWTDIALASGFHDQPHLVREFRRFAGQSPGEWRAAHVGSMQAGGHGATP